MMGILPLKCLILTFIFNFFFLSFVAAKSNQINTIATLTNLEGTVKILREKSQKDVYAREGILLFNGNKITTSTNSKAGILYRDGSRISLFQNSELTLNLSEEKNSNKRNFKHLLTFKKGSMRGRFKKRLQSSKIRTPNAIIGIKGTSFRILENNNNTTVSLTEGKLEVSNLSSKVTLETGQWIKNFDAKTNLDKKVASLPNILSLKTMNYSLDFQNGETEQIELSIQIQNSVSGKIVNRSGLIVFESNYKNINLPRRIFLNERGFAKILLLINPPSSIENEFYGLIKIRAFIDNENFEDVADGILILKIKDFRKKRNLLLHPDKGLIQKIQ